MKIKIILAITAVIWTTGGMGLEAASSPGNTGSGAPRMTPLNSHAFGTTVADLLTQAVRWVISGPPSGPWVVGRVQMVGVPSMEWISGSGTPDDPALFSGENEYILSPGTPIFWAPLWWYGERYQGYPQVPDDPPTSDALYLSWFHTLLTIDGKTIISEANKADFYVPETPLDPPAYYPTPSWYGSVAAVYFQGQAFLSPPLAPGRHVLYCYDELIIPEGAYSSTMGPYSCGVIYEQTIIITVSPK
jgi:hypothetical protein